MSKDISSFSVTKGLLDQYGLFAKKRLGQNFIVDPSVVKKIARESKTDRSTTVLEIGPGLGALTQQLAALSKKVISVEIDSDMVEILRNELELENVEIVHQDFLDFDLSKLENEELVVCANVPYYITTPILFKLIESNLNIKQITLMVQKELGDRLSAKVKSSEYNALSVIISTLYDVRKVMNVNKRSFHPMPKVDSIVIGLERKLDREGLDHFFDFVKKCFAQRRKTLQNNLKEFGSIEKVLDKLGYSHTIRPQEISVEGYKDLYKELYETQSIFQD